MSAIAQAGCGLETSPLAPAIGAEIRADPATLLRPEAAAEVRRLLEARGVLVFRELGLSDAEQVRFTRLLGTPIDGGDDGIYKISLDVTVNAAANQLKSTFVWHMAGTHDDFPSLGALLGCRAISPTGGETEFANTCAAYEAFPAAMKLRLAGLRVEHSVELAMVAAGVEASPEELEYWRSFPNRAHNLVWTHRSGRTSLVIGSHASHVIGMDRAASDALLGEVLDWATQPRFVYQHHWRVGDLVIWDNTSLLHRALPYRADSGRLMHRTTLAGDEPFA